MSYVDNIVPDVPFEGRQRRPSLHETSLGVRAWIVSQMESWRQHREEKRAIRHLRELSDHTLKDIGIDRSEISSMVRHGRSGRRSRA